MTSPSPDYHNVIQVLQQQIEQAENDKIVLRGQVDELKEQQRQANNDAEYLRKKVAALQQENTTYSNTQARLETQLYAQEQEIVKMRKEIHQLTKAKNDIEKKRAADLQDYENDRIRWQQREADLFNQVRTLSASHGEPRTPRTPRRRSITASTLGATSMSPFTNYPLSNIGEDAGQEDSQTPNGVEVSAPKLAAIDSSYAREAKIAQRTIRAQDKLIADLKNEIEKQKSIIQEQQTENQQQSLRMEHLEHEIANIKQVNRSLMEDNESYQILLHEKTISGEFMMNPIMQVDEAGEENNNHKRRSLKPSVSTSSNGLNLAAELNLAAVGTADWEANQKASETDKTILKLSEEIKVLQDTNRALQLYMNKILMKIINNKQLEDVLSIDQPKPQPPPSPQSKLAAAAANENKQPRGSTTAASSGPAPSRTLSSTLLGKANGNRQRRRTISYWGGNNKTTAAAAAVNDNNADDANNRRHSSMMSKEPQRPPAAATTTTTTNGGWAKALRRMSIGWSSRPQEDTSSCSSNNSSAITASNSDDSDATTAKSSSESARKSDPPKLVAPSMSRSTSTTSSSLRRSYELATLQEE